VVEILRAEYGFTGSERLVREHLRRLRPRQARPAQGSSSRASPLGSPRSPRARARTGRGTATFTRGTGRVPANEIAHIAERKSGTEEVRDVDYLIFGKTVTIGRGRYTLPKLKLAEVLALGPEPFSPARVWLEPDGDDQMELAIVALLEGLFGPIRLRSAMSARSEG
jgi:hypothetical protein